MATPTEMSNQRLPNTNQSSNWWSLLQREGYFFRPLAISVITVGVYLHVTRLLVGDDIFLARVATPGFDKLFVIPMALAGLAGLLSWRLIEFKNGWHKAFMAFIVIYIVVSIPIHLATYLTQSTEFLRQFPMWFSALILPYYAAVLITLWRLRFKANS